MAVRQQLLHSPNLRGKHQIIQEQMRFQQEILETELRIGDAQIPSSQDTSQTAGMADELTDNAQAEEQTSKGRTILLGFANEETKGTTENPYIYLGENIQAYPYYKYTLVGDLEKIKALAQDNQKKDAESVTNKNTDRT